MLTPFNKFALSEFSPSGLQLRHARKTNRVRPNGRCIRNHVGSNCHSSVHPGSDTPAYLGFDRNNYPEMKIQDS